MIIKTVYVYILYVVDLVQVPDGLGVRIPGFHPGGPGSIPGLGVSFFLILYSMSGNMNEHLWCPTNSLIALFLNLKLNDIF